MRGTAISLFAAVAVLLALALPAQQTVTATGTAAILNKDAAQARDRAVESALRAAVEQVVGTMVDSESLVRNNQLLSDKIYTQTTGYISTYKVTREKADPDTNIYTVTLDAAVKEGNLQDDLGSMGLLLRRMKMPRVAVALTEDGDTASGQLLRMLKDKGFLVVDTGSKEPPAGFSGMSETGQADLMKTYGAEVVILGSARGQAGASVGNSSLLLPGQRRTQGPQDRFKGGPGHGHGQRHRGPRGGGGARSGPQGGHDPRGQRPPQADHQAVVQGGLLHAHPGP